MFSLESLSVVSTQSWTDSTESGSHRQVTLVRSWLGQNCRTLTGSGAPSPEISRYPRGNAVSGFLM